MTARVAEWRRGKDVNWQRHPILDRRFKWGDDFAANAWVNNVGQLRYTAVGFHPTEAEAG